MLFDAVVKTYNNNSPLIGEYIEGKEPLSPVGHNITSADIEISLSGEGDMLLITQLKEKEKIIIPVTEESAVRTSGVRPHPLCEKTEYLRPENDEKYRAYMSQLEDILSRHEDNMFLKAVHTYVGKGTVADDLKNEGIPAVKSSSGKDVNIDYMVRWRVDGQACWKDKPLMEIMTREAYRRAEKNGDCVCMIDGRKNLLSKSNLPGICPAHGRAKLVSSNDNKGFTYKGRFVEPEQAYTISFENSQKFSLGLKWLVANQSVRVDTKYFVFWNPDGEKIIDPASMFLTGTEEEKTVPTEYKKRLEKALKGYSEDLKGDSRVIMAGFDALTTGCLNLIEYSELSNSQIIENLYKWDRDCCIPNGQFGVKTPSVYELVKCACGIETAGKNGKPELTVRDPEMARRYEEIVSCRMNGRRIPEDLVRNLARRASRPSSFKNMENYNRVLRTACCALRKHQTDHRKGGYEMEIETGRKDRSYQFGRVIAILEKIEKDTYQKGETRIPKAVRSMNSFVTRPMKTAEKVRRDTLCYLKKLSPAARAYYDRLLTECFAVIADMDEAADKPLEAQYLIGYYLQKEDFYKSRKTEEDMSEAEAEESDAS